MGIDFLPIAMGLFGISEILNIALEKYKAPEVRKIRLRELYPTREETRRSVLPVFRDRFWGFSWSPARAVHRHLHVCFLRPGKKNFPRPRGIRPGGGGGRRGPGSGQQQRRHGRHDPSPHSRNPFAAPSAIMLAGLRMHNIEPGPTLFTARPDIFWTFIAAMYIGNLMLLILNLPLVGLFGRIAVMRPQIILPVISLICLFGVYSVRNSMFDVWIMIIAGGIGFFLRRWKYPIAPLIIGLVLGPTTENSVRQTLMMFRGNLFLMTERPIAMALLGLAAAFIIYKFASPYFGKRIVLKGEERG